MTHAPLSQSCPTEESEESVEVRAPGPCPSVADPVLLQSRADHVIQLIAVQLVNQQAQLDAGFANHIIITYELEDLAVQFGAPIRLLLRSVTKALLSELLPCTCSITSDHQLRCLLKPTLKTAPSNPTNPTDSKGGPDA